MPFDLTAPDLGPMIDYGSAPVPDVTLPSTFTDPSLSTFTSSDVGNSIIPAGSTSGGSGIDWSSIGQAALPVVSTGIDVLSGINGAKISTLAGKGLRWLGLGSGGTNSPSSNTGVAPPLDTSIPIREPGGRRAPMGYSRGSTGGQIQGTRARTALQAQGYGRPHMNPLNPKALRRAISRVYRFEGFAKRVLKITSPHKHVAGVKHHRRRKRHF